MSATNKLESAERKELLRASRLKIERAHYHINDLSGKINAYLKRRPLKVAVVDDPEAGKRILRIKTNEPIPDNFSLVLGDAIHNLRTALDLIVFGMVGDKTPRPEAVQFPFCSRAERIDETIKSRQIEFAGKKIIDTIKSLKPYPGGDELLSGLHILDIADKHKLILAVGRTAVLSGDEISKILPGFPICGPGLVHFSVSGDDLIRTELAFQNRSERRTARFSEQELNVQPAFQICFGKGQPFPDQPIEVKLHAMVSKVTEVIEDLADAYL